MKKEVAEKWVQALRSGEYKQGVGSLQRGNKFCCLGVLCDIAKTNGIAIEMDNNNVIFGGNLISQPSVKHWSGMQSNVRLSVEMRSLIRMNDGGNTFEEIADMIEKNWEIL